MLNDDQLSRVQIATAKASALVQATVPALRERYRTVQCALINAVPSPVGTRPILQYVVFNVQLQSLSSL